MRSGRTRLRGVGGDGTAGAAAAGGCCGCGCAGGGSENNGTTSGALRLGKEDVGGFSSIDARSLLLSARVIAAAAEQAVVITDADAVEAEDAAGDALAAAAAAAASLASGSRHGRRTMKQLPLPT